MKISRGSSYKVALRFQGLHAIYHKCWSYFHTCTHFVLLRQTADSSFKYIYRPHNSSTWNNSLGSNNNKSDTEIYFKTVKKQKKHTDKQNQLIQTLFCTKITRMNQIFFFCNISMSARQSPCQWEANSKMLNWGSCLKSILSLFLDQRSKIHLKELAWARFCRLIFLSVLG